VANIMEKLDTKRDIWNNDTERRNFKISPACLRMKVSKSPQAQSTWLEGDSAFDKAMTSTITLFVLNSLLVIYLV